MVSPADAPAGPEGPDSGRSRWSRTRALVGRWMTAPEYRRLRWILFLGLLVRLLLAPLTSWAFDTPGFISSGLSALYLGNPYAGALWYNPPLAAFLATPLLGLTATWFGPQSLIPILSSAAPMAIRTGVDVTYVPIPAALLAWKMPLIACDVGVALLLYRLARYVRPESARATGQLLALAWFLNPVVIWATAVHGDVDTVAALLVLLFLVASLEGRWLSSGLFLGLAVFAKGYPIVLLPMAIAAAVAWPTPVRGAVSARLETLGRFVAGVLIPVALFAAFLSETFGVLATKAAVSSYGGISILSAFNLASPKAPGWYFAITGNPGNAGPILELFRAFALLSVVGGTLLVGYVARRQPIGSPERFRTLVLGALWAVTGILLADSAPQSENLLAVLPLLALALPARGSRALWSAFTMLSTAGLLLYFALLTPFAMFYPLARLIGPGAVAWINGVVIAYVDLPFLQGALFLTAGLVGGSALLWMWFDSGWQLVPVGLRRRLWEVIGRREAPSAAPRI